MTKFAQVYQEMVVQNQELFDTFKTIHANYMINRDAWQEKFNTVGGQVVEVIKKYENILCGKTEGGGYGKYSSNLSEKFWNEVRKNFPKIDFVGVKIG